jgi:hypothetical protein
MAETPTETDVFEAYVRLRNAVRLARLGTVKVDLDDLNAILAVPWNYVTDEATLRKAIDAFNTVMADNGHPHLPQPLLRTHPTHLAAMKAAITTLLGGDKK